MADAPDVNCPIVTPFTEDGAVDEDALAALVDHLASNGVDGFVPCGTTGEFATLTDDEWYSVVETTVDAAPDEAPVMAGVGATAPETVRHRIRAADELDADSVLVTPPYYGGQASAEGNEAFFREVLGDAPLPAHLYNIPSAVGQKIQVDAIVSLAEDGHVTGIKDSSGDVTHFQEILRRTPDEFTVYQGWDAAYVSAMVMGADGGINALAHLYPEALTEAAVAAREGDFERARSIQFDTLDPAFQVCAEHGFGPVVKAALEEEGVIPSATVRPPQEELSAPDREDVLATLHAAGN